MSPADAPAGPAWRPVSADAAVVPGSGGRVLLLIEGQGNRQQISQQLVKQYEIVRPDAGSLPADSVDLIIADGPALRKWHDALVETKSAEQPVFLPLMLILSRGELRGRTGSLAGIVDDFVTTPIVSTEFLERIDILLRARRQALEQRGELVRMVNYDRTTTLPNRHLFTERVASSIQGVDRQDLKLFVLVIHIPLAHVLETMGEQAVEQAARACSRALCEVFDEDVGLARLSMEKWAVRLLTARTEQVFDLCARIDHIASRSIEAGGESLHIRPRIGIATYPDDASTAAGQIDAAIAASSRAHDGEPAFYASEQRDAALHYLRTEAMLHEALAGEQFELWLQPKLALQTGLVTHAEALIRWRLPSGELVPPGNFIPVAETSGFIRDITRWVIATAVHMIAEWGTDFRIAVNVTPVDIQQPDFLHWLQGLCMEHAISPQSIELELTETMIFDMNKQTMEHLRNLRDRGFSIAIDDFGTGYSSLGYLHQLPVHTLKIDKSFIDNIPGDSDGAVVTRAIISLAREFGLGVVAEGIESEDQLEYLRSAGVDYAQGFFIARPMPINEFRTWLAHRDS